MGADRVLEHTVRDGLRGIGPDVDAQRGHQRGVVDVPLPAHRLDPAELQVERGLAVDEEVGGVELGGVGAAAVDAERADRACAGPGEDLDRGLGAEVLDPDDGPVAACRRAGDVVPDEPAGLVEAAQHRVHGEVVLERDGPRSGPDARVARHQQPPAVRLERVGALLDDLEVDDVRDVDGELGDDVVQRQEVEPGEVEVVTPPRTWDPCRARARAAEEDPRWRTSRSAGSRGPHSIVPPHSDEYRIPQS